MRFNPSEVLIEDHVIRMHHAFWVQTCNNRALDLSRYPRLGVLEDEDENQPPMFAIVAYPSMTDDDTFELIAYYETPDAAAEYFQNLISMLRNPSTVH